MSETSPDLRLDDEIHFCAAHPERDTGLRCNRCERYMCVDCARRTPIGYTCRECVRSHENRFFEGTMRDYAVVAVVSALGGAIVAGATFLFGGFLLLGIIAAPAIGGMTAQIALQLTRRRRGRQSGYVSGGALLAGGLIAGFLLTGLGLFTILYLALAVSAAFASFKVSI